jgi:hypothetical protein
LDPSSITTLKYRLSTEHLPGTKMVGFIELAKNQIEIWYDGKKIKKLHVMISGFVTFSNIQQNKIELKRI